MSAAEFTVQVAAFIAITFMLATTVETCTDTRPHSGFMVQAGLTPARGQITPIGMAKSSSNEADKAELERRLKDRGTTKGAPVTKPGPVVVAK